MRLHRLWLLLFVMLLAVSGCGSSSGGGGGDAGADPAQAIPPGTPVYVEGAVRPDGDQGDAARALLEKFLPPGSTLESLLDDAIKKDDDSDIDSYAKDVKPWLGERVGFGVSELTGSEPKFVGAVAITDAGKAEDFLAKDGKKAGDYYRDDDLWADVAGDFIVFAESEADLKNALKAQKGDSLGDSQLFEDALGELPDERLGAAFFDLGGLIKTIDSTPGMDAATRAVLKQFYGDNPKPITAALTAEDDSATIESRYSGAGLGALGLLGTGASTDLVEDAPADAFAAFGVADVGGSLQELFTTAIGAFGGAAVSAQLESQLGIDLDRDLFSWIGDLAIYAHGNSEATLNGALVIKAKDRDAAAAALPRLIAAAKRSGAPVQKASVKGADQAYAIEAPQAPGAVTIALGGDLVVAAYGSDEAARALNPSGDTLGASGRFEDAKDAVDGIAPSLIVNLPGVLELAESLGATSDDDYQEAKPYLEKLDQVVTGSEKDGDTLRSLFTVTVK